MPRMAEVAKTCPLLPTDSTTIDATTTIKSENVKKYKNFIASILVKENVFLF